MFIGNLRATIINFSLLLLVEKDAILTIFSSGVSVDGYLPAISIFDMPDCNTEKVFDIDAHKAIPKLNQCFTLAV